MSTENKPISEMTRYELLAELAYHCTPVYYQLIQSKTTSELRDIVEYNRYKPQVA